jgi:hypothetical protein
MKAIAGKVWKSIYKTENFVENGKYKTLQGLPPGYIIGSVTNQSQYKNKQDNWGVTSFVSAENAKLLFAQTSIDSLSLEDDEKTIWRAYVLNKSSKIPEYKNNDANSLRAILTSPMGLKLKNLVPFMFDGKDAEKLFKAYEFALGKSGDTSALTDASTQIEKLHDLMQKIRDAQIKNRNGALDETIKITFNGKPLEVKLKFNTEIYAGGFHQCTNFSTALHESFGLEIVSGGDFAVASGVSTVMTRDNLKVKQTYFDALFSFKPSSGDRGSGGGPSGSSSDPADGGAYSNAGGGAFE